MKSFICYIFLAIVFLPVSELALAQDITDSVLIRQGKTIQKAIYNSEYKEHKRLYNWAWGSHYRSLYHKPISVNTIYIDSLSGGMFVKGQLPKLHALVMGDRDSLLYLLKPIGGSSSFLESKFFRDVYVKEDFKDTYLNQFISEAYTIIPPYMFIVSERLARLAGVGLTESSIAYVAKGNKSDTIADGSSLVNKLVSISCLPDIGTSQVINDIDTLLDKLQEDRYSVIDKKTYIRARLFDMLIGDWNKIPENWYWIPTLKGDSTVYIPQSLDRSHAFSKVDGVFFKELLGMLGLNFITDYKSELKDVKKFNKLAFPLDIALTQNCSQKDWFDQAEILKYQLTNDVINQAFSLLPVERHDEETNKIKRNLIERKNKLSEIALEYYLKMQKTPVITGSAQSEKIVVEQGADKELLIRIYNKTTGLLNFEKRYSPKYTKEIWLYGLGGNDDFEIDKQHSKIRLLVIGGEGINNYKIDQAENVSLYERSSEKDRLKSIEHARMVIPNDEKALDYDYQKQYYTNFSVTPIGLYDSDLGLNIGTSVAYTIYGFRRAPYTRRHQFSYDYVNGFTYQGIFPSYDQKKRLHVAAYIGSPAYFSNFFGFGNNTSGYKNEQKNYNRVNISKYMLTPALYYNIQKDQEINLFSSFEVYKVKNPDGRNRFINTVYEDGHSIYSSKYFLNVGVAYELKKKMSSFVSKIDFSATAGYYLNLGDAKRNYPYAKGMFAINLRLTDRLTFATQLKGTVLFTDKYEFYQAATTELRGFRDNRFIGKRSFYQYSDIRYDMGKLENPLAPLSYGLFAGIDHGRVWYQEDNSKMWHSSYGGGFWLTIFRKFTGKFSWFGSSDGSRLAFQLGMGF